MSRKTYLGYKTLSNKDAKLKGIIDFFYNCTYGLGLSPKSINLFLANCAKVAIQDKTQTQYASKFITWLSNEDERFNFPSEYFEFKRLRTCIRYMPRMQRIKRNEAFRLLRMLYFDYPHLLKDVGAGRKFKDVFDCCDHYLLRNRSEKLKPIRHLRFASAEGCRKIAEKLYERFDKYQVRVIIARLIELYKEDQQASDAEPAKQL